MNINFDEFKKGLSKYELSHIQNECLEASNRCPQSLTTRDCPKKIDSQILDFWCNNDLLFNFGYDKYLSKSTIETLKKYKAYKILKK